MQNIQVVNNELFVQLNHSSNKKYKLKNQWPLNTIWNINGHCKDENITFEDFCSITYNHTKEMLDKDPRMKQALLQEFNKPCYIEVFIETDEVDTYDGVHGKTYEECEEILWNRFQNYKKCNHEFSRDNKDGKHYDNGLGFCIHCGMSKSNVFLPERTCINCGQPTNSLDIENKTMCSKCQSKKGLSSYGYISSIISKELLEKKYTLSSWYFDEKILSFNINNKLSLKYGAIKESEGIYILKFIDFKGSFTIIEHMRFCISEHGQKIYFVQKEALNIMADRIQKECIRNKNMQTLGLQESYNIMKGSDDNEQK